MLHDLTTWAADRSHVLLLTVGNGCAWAQSLNTGNLSVGTVVTVCTIAVPAIGGAVIYIIKTVGPVWLKYREDRDKMMASTMAGQMERLSRNLEEERESGAAKAQLAESLKAVATLATQRADLAVQTAAEMQALIRTLAAKVDDGNKMIAEASARVEDANQKLHAMRNAAQAAEARALEAEHDNKVLQGKLDEAIARLNRNNDKFEDNAAKLDQVSARVEGITQFGAAVADAADALVHPVAQSGERAAPKPANPSVPADPAPVPPTPSK